jgi:hypothetical protein
MAITEGYKKNFETLRRAFDDGNVALVECKDNTGAFVYTICAMSSVDDSSDVAIVPLARLFDGNPYDELIPPE